MTDHLIFSDNILVAIWKCLKILQLSVFWYILGGEKLQIETNNFGLGCSLYVLFHLLIKTCEDSMRFENRKEVKSYLEHLI